MIMKKKKSFAALNNACLFSFSYHSDFNSYNKYTVSLFKIGFYAAD